MKTLFITGVMTLIASHAFAQAPDAIPASTRSTVAVEDSLATPTGHEVSAAVASYTYREPGAQAISIHGTKFLANYIGTLSLNERRHWFFQGDVRSMLGNVTYNGWCSPFVITPDSVSPNGYDLDVGKFVAVQREWRQGLVSGNPRPHRQGRHQSTMGMVTV
jgi:hypothetical protein